MYSSQLLRDTRVIRTYHIHKNPYIPAFFVDIFGPDYYWYFPAQYIMSEVGDLQPANSQPYSKRILVDSLNGDPDASYSMLADLWDVRIVVVPRNEAMETVTVILVAADLAQACLGRVYPGNRTGRCRDQRPYIYMYVLTGSSVKMHLLTLNQVYATGGTPKNKKSEPNSPPCRNWTQTSGLGSSS